MKTILSANPLTVCQGALLSLALLILPGKAQEAPPTAGELAKQLSTALQDGSSGVRLKLEMKAAPGAPKSVLQLQIKSRRTPASTEVLYQVLWPKERKGESFLLRKSGNQAASGTVFVPPATMQSLSAAQMQQGIFGSDLAYEDLLPAAGHDVPTLKALWAKVPTVDRVSPAVAVCAAQAFMALGQQQEAAAICEKALATQWDVSLLRAYRHCAATEGSATLLTQIENGENWLKERPNDAELALTLGVLCLKQKLWGKAQRYLEQAVSDASERGTVQQAHLQLAQLHEALSQPEQAATHYRQCAITTLPRLSKI